MRALTALTALGWVASMVAVGAVVAAFAAAFTALDPFLF